MKVQGVKVRGSKVGVVCALVSLCVGLLLGASGCEGRAYAQEAVLECGAPELQAAPVAASFAGPRVLELQACEGLEGRKRDETRRLVEGLRQSNAPGAARAAELLARAGTRAALEDVD